LISMLPLYLMKPSLRNLFMKKLTRGRVVPIISARVSKSGASLKVPLGELAESKEKVRSALNRATRKAGRNVVTASDDSFLYVWNEGA